MPKMGIKMGIKMGVRMGTTDGGEPRVFGAGVPRTTQVLDSSKQSAKAMVASSSGKVDATARLGVLKTRLFRAVCRRVCKGLLNKDRLLFALRLAQVTTTPWNAFLIITMLA